MVQPCEHTHAHTYFSVSCVHVVVSCVLLSEPVTSLSLLSLFNMRRTGCYCCYYYFINYFDPVLSSQMYLLQFVLLFIITAVLSSLLRFERPGREPFFCWIFFFFFFHHLSGLRPASELYLCAFYVPLCVT